MLATVNSLFKSKWHRLTTQSGSRRLSWFAITLLFALDAFVLNLLFQGMGDTQRLLGQPTSRISRSCLAMSAEILQEKKSEQINSMAWAAERVEDDRERAMSEFDHYGREPMPLCAQVRDKLLATVSDSNLLALFEARRQVARQIEKTESDIKRLKDSYSDALLEKIADQQRSASILPVEAGKIKSTVDEMNMALARLRQQQTETDATLANHPLIVGYFSYLKALPIDNAFAAENARYERETFWHPVKVLAAQAGFILPLLLLAVFWNKRAIKNQRETQILISAHLILVGAIPILLRLLYLVQDLLPEELLGRIMQFLRQWNLSFIWYYLAIFASVCCCLLFILIAQRTLFTAARQRRIRLRKAQCRNCGENLRSSEQAWCEICGAGQCAPCGHCGQTRRLLAFHCNHCGIPLDTVTDNP